MGSIAGDTHPWLPGTVSGKHHPVPQVKMGCCKAALTTSTPTHLARLRQKQSQSQSRPARTHTHRAQTIRSPRCILRNKHYRAPHPGLLKCKVAHTVPLAALTDAPLQNCSSRINTQHTQQAMQGLLLSLTSDTSTRPPHTTCPLQVMLCFGCTAPADTAVADQLLRLPCRSWPLGWLMVVVALARLGDAACEQPSKHQAHRPPLLR